MRTYSQITAALLPLFLGCDANTAEHRNTEVYLADHAMVVSAHPLATELGVAVLRDGGNAIDAAVASFGRLDILVNNAAIGTDTPLTETPLADWNRVMAVNLTGPFLMARAAVKQMLTQEMVRGVRGRIVNITSQHGMVAAPNDIAYGVSKSGLVYMTRQIAVDYAKHHILCNAVAPGKILTGKTGRAVDPAILAYSESRTPMPRLGTPDDVAGAALFLASDDASYVTGENLMVDGGWMAF